MYRLFQCTSPELSSVRFAFCFECLIVRPITVNLAKAREFSDTPPLFPQKHAFYEWKAGCEKLDLFPELCFMASGELCGGNPKNARSFSAKNTFSPSTFSILFVVLAACGLCLICLEFVGFIIQLFFVKTVDFRKL